MALDLAFDLIPGGHATHTIAFLHGILGRGNNLRSIAKRFVDAKPDWAAMLVDLRGHGKSAKGSPEPSIEAAAKDVVQLAARSAPSVAAIAAHSFGGKVALESTRLGEQGSLKHVVLIDSSPGARREGQERDSPLAVIETIKSLPESFASRSEFIDAVVAAGQTLAVAQWLAQSCEQVDKRIRFALNLDEMGALLDDYLKRDLWPVVENPPNDVHVHLVIADRSNSYTTTDRERALKIASRNPRVTVDILAAGHWIHMDSPDELLRTLLNRVES
jgi:pimeloyl-ACP methyl ester carboxylesterase